MLCLLVETRILALQPGRRFSKIARHYANAAAGKCAIILRHPKALDCGAQRAGTWTRRRRRYSEGLAPTRRANELLKLPRLENPTSMHTAVTES
jgi:hypothetical protein